MANYVTDVNGGGTSNRNGYNDDNPYFKYCDYTFEMETVKGGRGGPWLTKLHVACKEESRLGADEFERIETKKDLGDGSAAIKSYWKVSQGREVSNKQKCKVCEIKLESPIGAGRMDSDELDMLNDVIGNDWSDIRALIDSLVSAGLLTRSGDCDLPLPDGWTPFSATPERTISMPTNLGDLTCVVGDSSIK